MDIGGVSLSYHSPLPVMNRGPKPSLENLMKTMDFVTKNKDHEAHNLIGSPAPYTLVNFESYVKVPCSGNRRVNINPSWIPSQEEDTSDWSVSKLIYSA